MARIAVEDRGPGVPECQIAKLFDPFFRVVLDGPVPAHGTGSGLGLAIAFEAVKKHGGRGNPMDLALGFRMGSDDYLAKPFGGEELVLHIQAILRRSNHAAGQAPPAAVPASAGDRSTLRLGDVELAMDLRRVFENGVEVQLTSAEFDILRRLFESPGEIVTREELCRIALGRELNAFDRSVDNLTASLRKKLSYGDSNGARIQSARGRGYFYSPR